MPSAFIKKDAKECVLRCESDEVLDALTNSDNPECKGECPTIDSSETYINTETWYNTAGVKEEYKICVKSCSLLNPSKYINGSNCVVTCDYYIDDFEGDKPTCVENCSSDKYIDEITYSDKKICVNDCSSLKVPAYAYAYDNTKKCTY